MRKMLPIAMAKQVAIRLEEPIQYLEKQKWYSRELALAMSLVSVGSNQTLFFPHFKTALTRRFCKRSFLKEEPTNLPTGKEIKNTDYKTSLFGAV